MSAVFILCPRFLS